MLQIIKDHASYYSLNKCDEPKKRLFPYNEYLPFFYKKSLFCFFLTILNLFGPFGEEQITIKKINSYIKEDLSNGNK